MAAVGASVGAWLGRSDRPVDTLVDVEISRVFFASVEGGDTLYFSPDYIPAGDTIPELPRYNYIADSVAVVTRVKGVCVGRDGEVQVAAPDVDKVIEGNRFKELINKELLRIDSLATLLHLHVEELDYYARTHSAVDAGYNEVMAFGEMQRNVVQQIDSARVLMRRLASMPHPVAQLRTRFKVNGRVVRFERQEHGLVRLVPISHNDSIERRKVHALREILFPWTLHEPLSVRDSVGNRHILTPCDTTAAHSVADDAKQSAVAFTGYTLGIDGSYYRGEYDAEYRREGVGFAVDDKLVKYGVWRAGKFQGEQMLYTSDRIYGIDISRYQHELQRAVTVRQKTRKGKVRNVKTRRVGIDWDRLRITSLGPKASQHASGEIDYPVSFVFIKCTQGTTIRSNYYASDLAAARRRGIPVAPYHFLSHTKSGALQARYFIANAQLGKVTMPPMLDVEPTDAQVSAMGGSKAMFREILAWMQMVERQCGRRPVLYVSQMFVNRYMPSAPAELLKYDVWIARYGEYRPYVKLKFWQLTPYGRVQGIYGDVDINVFNGDRAAFEQWIR